MSVGTACALRGIKTVMYFFHIRGIKAAPEIAVFLLVEISHTLISEVFICLVEIASFWDVYFGYISVKD